MENSIHAKKISNEFKNELGFVNSAALESSELKGELEVIPDIGFCHFHHRKDSQVTIYEIAVLEDRQKEGWGRILFYRVLASAIEHKKSKIVVKCPVHLESNGFYQSLGFKLIKVDPGRKRRLNIYEYNIQSPLLIYCADGGRNEYGKIANQEGWFLGLRSDQTKVKSHCFMVDNHWKAYNHGKHLEIVKNHKPFLATAQDIEYPEQYNEVLNQCREISKYCGRVILIPKCKVDLSKIDFPYWLAFSVPTKYGGCKLPISFFENYPVHLLGGSPSQQSHYAKLMDVKSLDSNYAMKVARFGKSCYVGCDGGQKLVDGNYESFRLSMKKQREFWYREWCWEDEPLAKILL